MSPTQPALPADFAAARVTIAPHLRGGEVLEHYGAGTLVPDTDRSQILIHGVLYLTSHRIVFWPASAAAPDHLVELSEVRVVSLDDRPLADGYQMMVVATNGGEAVTLITESDIADTLADEYPDDYEDEYEESVDESSSEDSPPGTAPTGAPGPRTDATDGRGAEPDAPRLPSVRAPIPLVELTPRTSRTLSPATFHRHETSVRAFMSYSARQSPATLRSVLDSYIDELTRDIRREMEASRIAPCPDDGVHAALQFGAAIALSERECGWSHESSTHPVAHATLFLVQQGLVDDFGLGSTLPLEASYRCAKAGRYLQGVFRT